MNEPPLSALGPIAIRGAMSDSEIIGELAQSALTARALEPGHGESAGSGTQSTACLNCGAVLTGAYCANCGQAGHVHRTLSSFFHDFLHGAFHFEGKIWRTIPALMFRPGKMTRAYIDGKRASYVSPIALFLFSLFLMFAVVKQFGVNITNATDVNVNGRHLRGMQANETELARLQQVRAQLVAQHQPTAQVDGEIAGRKSGIKVIEQMRNPMQISLGPDDKTKVYSNIPAVDAAIREAKGNPQLALFKLQTNAYKFAWMLIPISVPFIWLLFPFSRRFALYDHTVFVTYSLCMMMVLAALMTLGAAAGFTGFAQVLSIAALLHIYKHLRYTYGLTRWGTVWRTAAICAFALVAMVLFGLVMMVLGAME